MKAAIINGPFDLTVRDVEKPVCGPDELLVKIQRAAICNATDYQTYDGTKPYLDKKYDWFPTYPHIMGHESCDEVIEIGEKVTEFQVGDRIACYWACGSFAEYRVIDPEKVAVVKISENVSSEEGALLEPVTGTLRAIYSAGISPGDNVAILGQGPMGLLLAQEARIFGAEKVVTIDLIDFRLRKSEELGADLTFNLAKEGKEAIVQKVKSKVGEIDVVFSAIGNDKSKKGEGINLGIEMLKDKATFTIYGPPSLNPPVNMVDLYVKNIHMSGIECPLARAKKLIKAGERLVSQGKLQLKPLITHHVTLDEVEKGLELCNEHPDQVLKVIVDIT